MGEEAINPQFRRKPPSLIPACLDRRSYFLQVTSRAKTSQERLKELLADEEKLYRITSIALGRPKIPGLHIKTELNKLLELKRTLENVSIQCNDHISFLTKKVSDLKHATPFELQVPSGEVATFIARMGDFLTLFNQLQAQSRTKIGMADDNIRFMKRR